MWRRYRYPLPLCLGVVSAASNGAALALVEGILRLCPAGSAAAVVAPVFPSAVKLAPTVPALHRPTRSLRVAAAALARPQPLLACHSAADAGRSSRSRCSLLRHSATDPRCASSYPVHAGAARCSPPLVCNTVPRCGPPGAPAGAVTVCARWLKLVI